MKVDKLPYALSEIESLLQLEGSEEGLRQRKSRLLLLQTRVRQALSKGVAKSDYSLIVALSKASAAALVSLERYPPTSRHRR